jgi:hypothetical protein
MRITKVGLSGIMDKKYVCDDGINTLAHGHFRIKDLNKN